MSRPLPGTSSKHISSLPAYNWDVKDYWIKWTEPREAPVAAPAVAAPVAAAPAAIMERPMSAVLHYVVKKTLTPKVEITFKSSAADPALKAAILGHRLRDVPVCPGGVFCEMGLEGAQYALSALGKKNVDLALLSPSFNRPFSMPTGESKAEILTTITMPTDKSLTATFKVSNGAASYDLGSCRFAVVDNKKLQSDWDKTSYFVHSRMTDVVKAAKNGDGHRFKPSIFYSLFSNTVKYAGPYMGLQEAYIAPDFSEAVAEVVLQQDPSDAAAKSSPYWSDSLVHLAGFVANVNPARPAGKMFMMGGFERSEQTAELAAGRKYNSYVRVTKNEGDAFVCDVFVFDVLAGNRLVMQCSNLKFHEVEYTTLERAIGKVGAVAAPAKAVAPKAAAPKKAVAAVPAPVKKAAAPKPKKEKKVIKPKAAAGEEVNVLDTLLAAIASETGTPVEDLTDDAVLGEIGIDSIMAIQISASVKGATGYDISATWGLEFPTIGALRVEFKDIMSAPGEGDGEDVSDEEVEEESEEEDYEMIADGDVDDPDEQDIESLDSNAAPAVKNSVSGKNVLDTFLGAIANETGTPLDELTDEVVLTELGVDSIMAIQICGTVNQETGVELPPTFVFEYPTVGDLRAEFAGMEANSSVGSSSGDEVGDDTDVTDADEPAPAPVAAPKPKEGRTRSGTCSREESRTRARARARREESRRAQESQGTCQPPRGDDEEPPRGDQGPAARWRRPGLARQGHVGLQVRGRERRHHRLHNHPQGQDRAHARQADLERDPALPYPRRLRHSRHLHPPPALPLRPARLRDRVPLPPLPRKALPQDRHSRSRRSRRRRDSQAQA